MRRALTDEEQGGKEILEHLALSNWKIEAGRPLGGHGQGLSRNSMKGTANDQ
jgi:hypothetical protein